MIESLYIKDFALIDELEVHFEEGFNVLTGQTGAGKSIIIGALNMILGERADTEVIRQGAKKAVAEAIIKIYENDDLRNLLNDNNIEEQNPLILRREIRESGSRAFINDSPVTISILREVGNHLVDLHGQHDHQLLLREENHLNVLDTFGHNESILHEYQRAYRHLSEQKKKLSDLRKREKELQEKTELFRFQLNELEQARLDINEEEELQAEMHRLDNAEELDQGAALILEMGTENEINISDLLIAMEKALHDMISLEPAFENYLDELNSARISIDEMLQFTDRYRSQIEFNPKRLEFLRQRQNELNRLQKKYTRTIPELIEYQKELEENLNLAENFDLEIERLEKQIKKQTDEFTQLAFKLHDKRVETGEHLSRMIEQELAKLGIPNAQFETKVEPIEDKNGWIVKDGKPIDCTINGIDQISFYISTNKGEQPKPLSKVASGGEISRIMLAMKTIIAREQSLPVMIFDEIDTGISGEISEKVGKSMSLLSENCQIIAITHQPQIASQANKHYRVEKWENNGRTVTRILPLNQQEHVQEVASLMSGSEITEAALTSARELISRSNH
ncbi:MAG TPA: DNA repair protein RecN [Balneolales bacterium]|nr:DNA repair protein RecN [Balneolales bacterium]